MDLDVVVKNVVELLVLDELEVLDVVVELMVSDDELLELEVTVLHPLLPQKIETQ